MINKKAKNKFDLILYVELVKQNPNQNKAILMVDEITLFNSNCPNNSSKTHNLVPNRAQNKIISPDIKIAPKSDSQTNCHIILYIFKLLNLCAKTIIIVRNKTFLIFLTATLFKNIEYFTN
jgi:hypothetical protein